MTPLKTPPIQAAYDHTKTALEMLERRLNDAGLDANALSARLHLLEALNALNASLAREAGQGDLL